MDKTRKTTSMSDAATQYEAPGSGLWVLNYQDALFIRQPAPNASQPIVPPAEQVSERATVRQSRTDAN